MIALLRNSPGISRLVWTSGIVLGASLPHWSTQPFWITGLLLLCVAWRFAVRLLTWPKPGPWLMRLLTFVAFCGVWFDFGTINGLAPGTALLVVMVSLKFLETETQRDHMILTVIAYFLVFASLLAGGGLVKALYLLAFIWLTTLGLIQVGRLGPLISGRQSGHLAGKLLLQSLPFMLVLFVIFPRLSGPLWALPAEDTSAVSGLSGEVSPGDITQLGLSDEIAFRIEFLGQMPAASELYWRGPVLTEFDGRKWTTVRPNVMRGTGGEDTIEYGGLTSSYRIWLEPNERGWLFAIDMPRDWQVEDNRRQRITMNDNYQLVLPGGTTPGRTLTYTVTSESSYQAREPLRPQHREHFTALPPGSNPRTRELMDRLKASAPDSRALINAALNVFAGEEFYYTLTPPPLGEHTADDFIFETREGFCEHYASAFAIMMRMAGLPARVVTGYQGGELNPYGGYYIVRQANAHAWTEVWTEEDGWIRVDPVATVAPERVSLGSGRTALRPAPSITQRIGDSSMLRQLALTWDAVDTAWNKWIIGYGPRLQDDLLDKLGLERISREALLLATVIATAMMMLALAIYFSLRMQRWHTTTDPALRCYRRFLRKLERLSVSPLHRGETPVDFAQRAAASVPASANEIESITAAYLAARYEPDHQGDAMQRLAALVREFRPRSVRALR